MVLGDGKQKQRVFLIQTAKADSRAILGPHALEPEDEFSAIEEALKGSKAYLQPPYDFRELERVVHENNILPSLIEAMEQNIDGTGWEILPAENDEEDEEDDEEDEEDDDEEVAVQEEAPKKKSKHQEKVDKCKGRLDGFFKEPWPGVSFLTIRRRLRRDLETLGNAYLEILRNVVGEVVACRWVDAKSVRLLRLGDPIAVKKKLVREGKEQEFTVWIRERRYVQVLNGKPIYFREFGSEREVDRFTGDWAGEEEERRLGGVRDEPDSPLPVPKSTGKVKRIPPERRGSELLHFVLKRDAFTPYGLPRWVSNVPSAIGGRKAELFNLDFFDAGGVPPMLIIVAGGALAEDAEKALREHFMATGKSRHQAAILEAFSTEGDLGSTHNVRVSVERFGAERQNDSMFENYLAKCEERLRTAFRLPPVFIGKSQDYSFATAFASYTVAEAQVFEPERSEFDEQVNMSLLRELDPDGLCRFRSLPLAVKDVTQQLQAIQLVKDMVEPEDVVDAVNQGVNLELRFREPEEQPGGFPGLQDFGVQEEEEVGEVEEPFVPGIEQEASPQEAVGLQKVEDGVVRLHTLAKRCAQEMHKGVSNGGSGALGGLLHDVSKLKGDELQTFRALLAMESYPEWRNDPAGAAELAGCTLAVLAANLPKRGDA